MRNSVKFGDERICSVVGKEIANKVEALCKIFSDVIYPEIPAQNNKPGCQVLVEENYLVNSEKSVYVRAISAYNIDNDEKRYPKKSTNKTAGRFSIVCALCEGLIPFSVDYIFAPWNVNFL